LYLLIFRATSAFWFGILQSFRFSSIVAFQAEQRAGSSTQTQNTVALLTEKANGARDNRGFGQ
jgi:hypothetical protein